MRSHPRIRSKSRSLRFTSRRGPQSSISSPNDQPHSPHTTETHASGTPFRKSTSTVPHASLIAHKRPPHLSEKSNPVMCSHRQRHPPRLCERPLSSLLRLTFSRSRCGLGSHSSLTEIGSFCARSGRRYWSTRSSFSSVSSQHPLHLHFQSQSKPLHHSSRDTLRSEKRPVSQVLSHFW